MKLILIRNKEWGSKARKDQEHLRNLTNQDRRLDVQERIEAELDIISDVAEAEREALVLMHSSTGEPEDMGPFVTLDGMPAYDFEPDVWLFEAADWLPEHEHEPDDD